MLSIIHNSQDFFSPCLLRKKHPPCFRSCRSPPVPLSSRSVRTCHPLDLASNPWVTLLTVLYSDHHLPVIHPERRPRLCRMRQRQREAVDPRKRQGMAAELVVSPDAGELQSPWVVKAGKVIKAWILALSPSPGSISYRHRYVRGAKDLTQLLSLHSLPLGACTPQDSSQHPDPSFALPLTTQASLLCIQESLLFYIPKHLQRPFWSQCLVCLLFLNQRGLGS